MLVTTSKGVAGVLGKGPRHDHPTAVLSIIIDGMDQNKTAIPHFAQKTKESEKWKPKTHVTGVIVHGLGLALAYVDNLRWPHDSNPTINILLSTLQKVSMVEMLHTDRTAINFPPVAADIPDDLPHGMEFQPVDLSLPYVDKCNCLKPIQSPQLPPILVDMYDLQRFKSTDVQRYIKGAGANFMSDEESEDDDNNTVVVRPPPWRCEKLGEYLQECQDVLDTNFREESGQ
ncbi:hypothetical protein Bbelb_291350 [Branchiostoma belcheri]|nr:hypothetical protein Bbelb_291350 [Branchiostoma belcheri]